jgi:hypothetical protein
MENGKYDSSASIQRRLRRAEADLFTVTYETTPGCEHHTSAERDYVYRKKRRVIIVVDPGWREGGELL